MNIAAHIIICLIPLPSNVQNQAIFERYPPPWTKEELKEADTEQVMGYCAEEDQRCGHTEYKGGMGGRWVYCCPGLWCSPYPQKSKDLYSISCITGVSSDKDTCYYYEYVYEKFVCVKDNYYPPLPEDYKREGKHDKQEWVPVFPNEN